MRRLMRGYVCADDAVNYRADRVMMYGIFVLMGVLICCSVGKTFFLPSIWTLVMIQFLMVACCILGDRNYCFCRTMFQWPPRRVSLYLAGNLQIGGQRLKQRPRFSGKQLHLCQTLSASSLISSRRTTKIL